MTDVIVQETGQAGAIQLLLDLEAAGAADEVSLTLTDEKMPLARWEDLGRFLGSIDRRARWYIGDWLIFGEAVYGEDAAQGVESTTRERYSEAERVTGLDHGTLMNIRSVCARVAKARRRPELGFWIHAEVASLEPREQVAWLAKAIDEGWKRNELRDAIRGREPGVLPEPGSSPNPPPGSHLTLSERVEHAARTIYRTAQQTRDGYLVPAEAWAQLREALGEES